MKGQSPGRELGAALTGVQVTSVTSGITPVIFTAGGQRANVVLVPGSPVHLPGGEVMISAIAIATVSFATFYLVTYLADVIDRRAREPVPLRVRIND